MKHDKHKDLSGTKSLIFGEALQLNEIGIEGYYALINSRAQGAEPYLPSFRFEHCLVCIADSSGYIWLDPTSRFHGFGELSAYYQGVPTLVIKRDTTELVTTPVRLPQDSSVTLISGEIKENGSLQLNVTRRRTGEHAFDLRQYYLDIGPKERRERLTESLSADFPGVIVDTVIYENLDDVDQALNYRYSISVPNYVTTTGDLLFFRVPWAASFISDYIVDEIEREHPLQLWVLGMYGTRYEKMELIIPSTYSPMEINLDNEFESEDVSYQSDYECNNNILNCSRSIQIKNLEVPKDNYFDFKQFCDNISKEVRSQLVFTRK